jgi:uncharacterized protein involved in outer membrane biogenesis
VSALLVSTYALVGFVLAPGWIRTVLVAQIQEQLGATATIGRIRLNPFLLRAEIDDAALTKTRGETLVGFERLIVTLRVASLWHRAVNVDDIEIDGPFAHAVVAADGSVNLAALQPKRSAPDDAPDKPLPRIEIGAFKVSRGFLTYEDRSRPTPFSMRLDPIEFDLHDFSTSADSGVFTFSGATSLGERINWHGHLAVQPIESDGELQVESLQARTLWQYAEDRLAFAVDSGSIDLKVGYQFKLADAVSVRAQLASLAVRQLKIRPKGADVDWIVVPALDVDAATLDLGARKAEIASLVVTEPRLLAWLLPDGSVNLRQLAEPPSAGTAAVTASPAMPPSPAAADWQFALHQLKIEHAAISFEDRSVHPAVSVALAPLDVAVSDVTQDLGKAVSFQVATHVNGDGQIGLKGAVRPVPLTAAVDVTLANLNLASFQPYIVARTSMSLLSGRLSADTHLSYGTQPALALTGTASIADLHTVDNDLHDDFVNWKRLDLEGIAYQQGPAKLDIAKVVAVEPYARVIIEPDSNINVKRILGGPGTAAPQPQPRGPPAVAVAKPAPDAKVAAAKVAAKAAATQAAPALPIVIDAVEFASGQVNFSDLSIVPSFAAGVQQFGGSIRGLSSDPASRAVVDLHGEVAQFSPVSITGRVNLLSPVLYTDLGMRFSNIALSIFNPYSGKFAGYSITEGKLTTELDYKIDGRRLDARHHLVIDQLEFGDKTDSKDAVSLPVKLAVALLKDRNGVIDLDLPVDGSLDDPEFHLGPAVRKVLCDLIVKVATAPFALIGSLFGGGPEMQFVDFRPGDAALDAATVDKLKAMTKALLERPQLKVTVPIGVVPELDRPALVDARFAADLDQAAHSLPQSAGFAALPPAARLALLTQKCRTDLGAVPPFTDGNTDRSPPAGIIEGRIEVLSAALKAKIAIDAAALQNLGQQRALALQAALLADAQLDPERVFLAVSDTGRPQNGLVRLELSLQ